MKKHLPILFFFLVLFLTACRGEDELVVPSIETPTAKAGESFYLLNEGNMGSNKASLDFYDATTGRYRRNLFAEVNPEVVFELGDVGNDLQIYGERLYAVVNVSNLVEVMDRRTAKHLGQIAIPNCRYIAFEGPYAYISSYAGPVQLDPTARIGYVAKVDTATLSVVATCTVGFQPEQMAIVGRRLFVANSGGYRAPNYDRRLSVIDLDTFTEEAQIDVAPNLHQVAVDEGKLYVQSRGNYEDIAPNIYVVNPTTLKVEQKLDIPATRFCVRGGDIYALTEKALRIGNATLSLSHLQTPYGLAVNGQHIYVTDARDYVSPGTVYCYTLDGRLEWQATAGDIPAHFAFTAATPASPSPTPKGEDIVISRILTYRPAPGQFVNTLPLYTKGDTEATMCQKVYEAVGNGRSGLITLGGCGGYVEFALSDSVLNRPNQPDFLLKGNAIDGNSEAGIVFVAYDANHNGTPEPEEWFEIAGNAYDKSDHSYQITYTRPDPNHVATPDTLPVLTDTTYIAWSDNRGGTGYLSQNSYHTQPYFPQWLSAETLTFTSTRLPNNYRRTGHYYYLSAFGQGYVDDLPDNQGGGRMDIEWAVDNQGERVHLPAVHFIRIVTGLNQQLGPLGETSTEFRGFEALHP